MGSIQNVTQGREEEQLFLYTKGKFGNSEYSMSISTNSHAQL